MFQATSRTTFMDPTLSVDFAGKMLPGETIDTATVTAELSPDSGTPDAAPSATLSGDCQVDGTVVLQKVVDGVTAASYVYRFKAVLDSGRHLEADVQQTIINYTA